MATAESCRRKVRRHRLEPHSRSRVEFTYPAPHGRAMSLPLLDVSPAGFSFAMEEKFECLEAGATIDCVVLHVGRCAMRGDIMVIHVTPERGICGALFYPATDEDLIKLRAVMAGIEAATPE